MMAIGTGITEEHPVLSGGGDDPRAIVASFRRLPLPRARSLEGRWHVAHTRPRQEKALGEALVAMEIPCFLPLVSQVRYYEHRQRTVDLPLFPSYVFLFGTREHAYRATSTKRIAQMLLVEDQQRLEHELLQLDLALAGQAVLDPYPYLAIGRRVEVVRGPFQGMQGLIDERRSADRLILNVSMLGRSMSLEIDASLLEVVD